MRIFVDIGHPAHVHYFRNFIKIMEAKGHTFFVSSREKECTTELLNEYNISYFSRGTGQNSLVGKIMYMFIADFKLYKKARKFRPDFFLSFVSPYAAQVSWIMKKPHITFDDTEHASIARKFYQPFTKIIFTPYCFTKNLGPKQIRFNGFMELFHLHPNYFKPDSSIYTLLKISEKDKFVLLRLVAFKANHDIAQSGIDIKTQKAIIDKLKIHFKVFISSENQLPDELKQYKINIPANRIHDVLYYAEFVISEGATMASESAMLGTASIYVNSLNAGTIEEQERFGLIFGFRHSVGVLGKIDELMKVQNLKFQFQNRRVKMLDQLIDPTKMLIEYFESKD